MRTIEIVFRTNYRGADYNYKFDIKCVDVDDLCHAKNLINDYMEKMIDKEMRMTQNNQTEKA